MGEDVAEPSDGTPWDFWVVCYQVFREVLHGFTNYLESAGDGVDGLGVVAKPIVVEVGSVAFYNLDRFENVF